MAQAILELIREIQATEAVALNLSGNQLTEIPAEVWQLISLERLDLSNNQLSELPSEIGQLTALQTLNLESNQLSELPSEIGQLTALQTLNLESNQLSELPSEIGQLTALQTLDLTDNSLTALPPEIGQLNQLQALSLKNNQLTVLPPEIGQLTQLQALYLDNNQLRKLPQELRMLGKLERLILHGNDALSLPPEILGHDRFWESKADPGALLEFYFRSRQEPSRALLEAKILVVGQGAVGKTSLVKRLTEAAFDPDEQKTQGIDIVRWLIPAREPSVHIRVNIWDFGGQEIMHATHEFFLTRRSLYLLVLDARKGENESNLYYWLRIIQTYGGDAPVLVVTNKAEPPNRLVLNETRLLKDYAPNIRGFFSTSCLENLGFSQLRQAIAEQVQALEHVYNTVPVSFLATKTALEERTASEDTLDVSEYKELCQAQGIDNPSDQRLLLRFLHDLGSVLHFTDPDSPFHLEDTKILNPEWVTRGVYKILNNNSLMQTGGVLTLRSLDGILTSGEGYAKSERLFILGMMRKFELCFEFADDTGRYLVPELLSPREPEIGFDETDALNLEYHYELLSEGVIPRFIVRTHKYLTEKPTYWRSGVLLQIDQNRVLVRGHSQEGRVYVAVIGPAAGRRRALAVVRAVFQAIHQKIPYLSVQEMVPLQREPGHSVSYQHLKRLAAAKQKFIWPEGAETEYSVSELLGGIESDLSEPPTFLIEKVQLRGIRCFEDITLDFSVKKRPSLRTVILGDNATGKTTLLRAIALGLCDESSATALLKKVPGPFLRHDAGKHGLIKLQLIRNDSGESFSIRTEIHRAKSGSEVVRKKIASGLSPFEEIFVAGYGTERTKQAVVSYDRYTTADAVATLFDYTSSLQNPELVLRRQPVWLREQIEKKLVAILLLDQDQSALSYSHEGIDVTGPWGRQPLKVLSDGYRSTTQWLLDFLGWLVLARRATESQDITGIVLIDELEQHLHPQWQREIISQLRSQLPKVQFIVTSHSPLIAASVGSLGQEVSQELVIHLSRNSEGKIVAQETPLLKGLTTDQVLASPAFGYLIQADPEVEKVLAEASRLASKGPQRTAAEEKRYQRVKETIVEILSEEGDTQVEREVRRDLHENVKKRIHELEAIAFGEVL